MLVETLLESARRHSASVAASDPLRELSYADLVRLANVMRRTTERASRCERVGILLPSSVAFAGTFYGVMWAGRTAVPLNFLLQPGELAEVVRDAGLDLVFAVRHFEKVCEALPVRCAFLEDLPLKREMALERVRRKPAPPRVRDDDVAVILYTSGTAGVPKGVCLTFGNLRSNVEACIERARLTGAHRFLGVLPLFHSFGLMAMLLVPVALGAAVHYLPRFSPAGILAAVRDRRSSVLMAIASMYAAMLQAKGFGREDLASIEYAISGGEALSPVVYERFRERFGVSILQGYGLTETSPVAALDVPWSHRAGTVGQALPGVTIQAFDEAGGALPPGATGELWIRGPNVMKGYYNKPRETAEVMTADGAFKTGDMGAVDGEGYVSITGRKKEMIIVGGENVYPREVESVLDEHPAVSESAVIGQRDPTRGEVVVAFVLPRDGAAVNEAELREFCRDRLAGYKVPRRIIVRPELPRGPTGKVLKRRLHELL